MNQFVTPPRELWVSPHGERPDFREAGPDLLLSPLLIWRKRSDVSVTSAPPMLFPEALASATVVAEAALRAVLFGAFLFHPVDDLAEELFLNGDMCHGRSGRSTVPIWW